MAKSKNKSQKKKGLSSTFYMVAGLIGSLVGLVGSVATFSKEMYVALGIFLVLLILGLISLGYSFEI